MQRRQVTVKGTWLQACGKGSVDRTFNVTKVEVTRAREGSGFELMYHIDCDGSPWVVALCRIVK